MVMLLCNFDQLLRGGDLDRSSSSDSNGPEVLRSHDSPHPCPARSIPYGAHHISKDHKSSPRGTDGSNLNVLIPQFRANSVQGLRQIIGLKMTCLPKLNLPVGNPKIDRRGKPSFNKKMIKPCKTEFRAKETP